MSSISNADINQTIRDSEFVIKSIQSGEINDHIKSLDVDWATFTVSEDSKVFNKYTELGYIDSINKILTRKGQLFVSRLSLNLTSQVLDTVVDDKYHAYKKIHDGKNSATFLCKHNILGTDHILKVVRPGAAPNLRKSLQLVSSLGNIPNIVQPTDFICIELADIYNSPIILECVVFPFIEGPTLGEFLKTKEQPLNAHTLSSFIKQVGAVLEKLESIGAYHGDLHEENIIVNFSESLPLSFSVIDISFGICGSVESSLCKDTDLQYFRQHIWSLLSTQQRFLGKMSIRKYLGAEIFSLVTEIMSDNSNNFSKIKGLIEINPAYEKYRRNKQRFLEKRFSAPGYFKLQRYEEITNPEIALKLFSPFPELMDNISQFSNVVLSGSRGSGKSTYLAALAFFPKIETPEIDFRETLGIYFPCRQGEFRLLSPEMIDYEVIGVERIKHLMVIKIIRKTLECLSEAVEFEKLKEPGDYDTLKSLLSRFMGTGEIVSLGRDIVSEIKNLVSLMIRVEMKELDNIYDPRKESLGKNSASEIDLIKFFESLRDTFTELSNTRFHLLFDDAGYPNMPHQVQSVLNDLIISSNPVFCTKLSIERYSYVFQSSSGKQLECGHDYYEYDMARTLFSGAYTFGVSPEVVERYCHSIVEQRLSYFGYKSSEITEYLGDKHKNKFDAFVSSLANSRRNAYYCGWSMVWAISDRTPRNLLELISEIFSADNIDKNTNPKIITPRLQDRAIRLVSEKRLKSLTQISGKFSYAGETVSMGKRIFEITSAVGSAFRIYLKSEAGKKRKDQYLALERNDSHSLGETAQQLLQEMIRYGVLDDSRMDFARDDRVKKPLYVLNKIYCPAFGISYRRDQHLRLSHKIFEDVFLRPKEFINSGTKRLKQHSPQQNSHSTEDMFGDINDPN